MVESSMSPAIIKDAVQTTRLVVSTASLRLAVIWRFWGFRLSAQKALMRGANSTNAEFACLKAGLYISDALLAFWQNRERRPG